MATADDDWRDDPTDLRHPDFDGWRIIRQPGTSHDGHARWEQLEPSRARVTATDDHGTVRSWLVVIAEEDRGWSAELHRRITAAIADLDALIATHAGHCDTQPCPARQTLTRIRGTFTRPRNTHDCGFVVGAIEHRNRCLLSEYGAPPGVPEDWNKT